MKHLVKAFIGALFIGWMTIPSVAEAQMMCGERLEVLKNLQTNYAEAPISLGLASNGGVIEVLSSDNGTFTIIITQPNGMSCLLVSGENWEDLPKQVAGHKT
ncbi:MAG: hypothetical protein ISR52_00995 [Rhodospirillales bacterium]|nr:hypothetical protein [Rhodospirillales bacterium]